MRITWVVIAAAGAVVACRGRAPVDTAPVIFDADRLPHDRHADVPCTDCHDAAAVAAGVVRIPGSADHAPCDRGQCHQAEFTREPGPLCRVCHAAIDVAGATAPTMVAYPRTGGWRVMPARFSHRGHLDFGRMEAAVGFHVSCGDCHVQQQLEAPVVGGHAECARCHAAEVGLAGAPAMTDCTGCHDAAARIARHRRRLIDGDLHFDHRNHQADRRGQPIRCQSCHADSAGAAGRDDHPPPHVASCVACHDDSARAPATVTMRACQTCHSTLAQGIGRLAPRSHLPATEKPLDHTLAFRRDHGEDAVRDARRCANCHTQMSGNPRAACDECHQVMRPFDHNVMFRESDHGTSASTDPERCSTCHVVDYCVACHQQRPRSHLFGWLDEHGLRARINVRACFVCHAEGGAMPGGARGCSGDVCHGARVP
jgi:hypothetical protein